MKEDFFAAISATARRLRIPMPVPAPEEGGDLFEAARWTRPEVPSLRKYAEEAWSAPFTARGTVKSHLPFTAVEGRLETLSKGIPPLETSLASSLVPGLTTWSDKRPALPSVRDRLSASLVEKQYALSVQSLAACNNVGLLAAAVAKLTEGRTSLSPAEVSEVARASAAILKLTQANSLSTGRVMATSVVQVWHLLWH